MAGETDLQKLISGMKPEHNLGDYVFCTLEPGTNSGDISPLCSFQEKEGTTVILSKVQADKSGLAYSSICAWITLNVHSSLEAIGLTATVSHALAQAGISCNMVAAYYHDHLFVPVADADLALKTLQNMTRHKYTESKEIVR